MKQPASQHEKKHNITREPRERENSFSIWLFERAAMKWNDEWQEEMATEWAANVLPMLPMLPIAMNDTNNFPIQFRILFFLHFFCVCDALASQSIGNNEIVGGQKRHCHADSLVSGARVCEFMWLDADWNETENR